MRTIFKNRLNPGGFWAAAVYVLIVVIVYLLISVTTKPSNAGLDWIPLIFLAMPWYALDSRLLFPAFILNVGGIYLLGAIIYNLCQRGMKK